MVDYIDLDAIADPSIPKYPIPERRISALADELRALEEEKLPKQQRNGKLGAIIRKLEAEGKDLEDLAKIAWDGTKADPATILADVRFVIKKAKYARVRGVLREGREFRRKAAEEERREEVRRLNDINGFGRF